MNIRKLTYISIIISLTFCGCSTNKQLIDDYSNSYISTIANSENSTEESVVIEKYEEQTLENVNDTVVENNDIHKEKIEDTLPKEITISFVGDCTLGTYKGQGSSGNYNEYYDKYGGEYFFDNVRSIFENDDITFINLEGPITDRDTTVDKKFPISCRTEHISVLNNSSIEVCSLANNHSLDCGKLGLEDTINILDEHNIGYCGNGNVYRTTIENVNITCLAYNGWSATDELIASISKDIAYEKENGAHIVCVMFHWGIEREHYSNETQHKIAHSAIDAGADIVVGGHPHVIQGIEQYNNKTIVYSLGNFTFGANKNPNDKDTFIFQQTFIVNDSTVDYGDYNIIPCSISSEQTKNNYQPTLLIGDDAKRVVDRIKLYSNKYSKNIFEHCVK